MWNLCTCRCMEFGIYVLYMHGIIEFIHLHMHGI